MAIDPILFVALGAGYVAGRVYPSRGPWPRRASMAVVFVLLLLLGTSLSPASNDALLAAVPIGVSFVAAVLVATAALSLALRPRAPRAETAGARNPSSPFLGLVFGAAAVAGFATGRIGHVNLGGYLEPVLWALVALVAYDLRWSTTSLHRWWAPLLAAIGGALIAALVVVAVFRIPLEAALATSSGYGFYTLAGPLVTERFGAALGFIAFLTNFLRENLVMVTSPWIGRRLRGEGLAALGGATAMDTTLYFVTRYGDPDAAPLALTTGLVLTVVASVTIPLLLALPGA